MYCVLCASGCCDFGRSHDNEHRAVNTGIQEESTFRLPRGLGTVSLGKLPVYDIFYKKVSRADLSPVEAGRASMEHFFQNSWRPYAGAPRTWRKYRGRHLPKGTGGDKYGHRDRTHAWPKGVNKQDLRREALALKRQQ